MNLRETLQKFIKEYPLAKKETLKGHPLAELINSGLPGLLIDNYGIDSKV